MPSSSWRWILLAAKSLTAVVSPFAFCLLYSFTFSVSVILSSSASPSALNWFEAAILRLSLVSGPPSVICPNSSFDFPSHSFLSLSPCFCSDSLPPIAISFPAFSACPVAHLATLVILPLPPPILAPILPALSAMSSPIWPVLPPTMPCLKAWPPVIAQPAVAYFAKLPAWERAAWANSGIAFFAIVTNIAR